MICDLVQIVRDHFANTPTSKVIEGALAAGFKIKKCGRWQVWTSRRGCWRLDGNYFTARQARKQYELRKKQGYQSEMKRIVK